MSNLPATQNQNVVSMSATDTKSVVEQVKAIQHIMTAVMRDGTHYGVIPGCKQPSLYKQGSEVLLSAFKIAVEPQVTRINDGDHISYRVDCIGRHMSSGVVVGTGVGEASTAEEKYSWRAAVCPEEFDATPETRKRVKWFKGYQDKPAYSVNQVRTNVADIANTVLKMAKKRAQIDMTLTTLSASDCFSQDLEDLPEEYRDSIGDGQRQAKPNRYQAKERAASTGGGSGGGASGGNGDGPSTEAQAKLIGAKLDQAGKSAQALCEKFGVGSVPELKKSQVNPALDWIAGK